MTSPRLPPYRQTSLVSSLSDGMQVTEHDLEETTVNKRQLAQLRLISENIWVKVNTKSDTYERGVQAWRE